MAKVPNTALHQANNSLVFQILRQIRDLGTLCPRLEKDTTADADTITLLILAVLTMGRLARFVEVRPLL